MLDKTLEKLGIRDEEGKAFIFLLENGEQTAGNLAKKTGLSRPSLYGFLKKLQEKGLVVQSQKNGVKIFLVSTQERISSVIEEQVRELEDTKLDLQKAFLDIAKGKLPKSSPRLQIFEGQAQQTVKDILLYRNMEVRSYWPIRPMLEVLGEDFFKQFNKDRIKRNIYIKAIWPENQKIDVARYPFMGVGAEFLRETRVAPKEIDFSMGYWIYQDKVLFVSSKKDNFSFIFECKDFAQMLATQFDVVWNISKELKVPQKSMQPFLDEIK